MNVDDKVLIIAGNINQNTFGNTLHAIQDSFGQKSIRTICIIRTSISNDNLPDWRSICFKYFPFIRYMEETVKDDNDYAVKLPSLLYDFMMKQHIDANSIIVDLTNASKTWCDFVYLVCTLMQVKTLVRLKVPSEYFRLPYTEVPSEALRLLTEPVLDFSSLQSIVRASYSEYVSFLREINIFIEWLDTKSNLSLENNNDVYNQLLNAFESYMRNDYQSAIIKISTFLEEVLTEILLKLSNHFKNEWPEFSNAKEGRKYPPSLANKAKTLSTVCTRANMLLNGIHNKFTETSAATSLKKNPKIKLMAPLIPVGNVGVALSLIRNYSGHGNKNSSLLQTEAEARYMFDSLIYILNKIKQCNLLER